MLNKLRSMAVFVRVVEAGSFRGAAERLGLSASVVSHHISQLEQELGVQLLYRSTRHVTLTDQGSRFFESCKGMVLAAEDALQQLNGEQMTGMLRVVVPSPLAFGPFLDDVAEFCKTYPGVDLRLEFDDSPRNIMREGIDVAIRIGDQPDSSLICRPLRTSARGLFAAPEYLEKHGAIRTLEDLQQARWIIMNDSEFPELVGPDKQSVTLRPHCRVAVNNIVALFHLGLAGLGVISMAAIMVFPEVAAGKLVRVLPEWNCTEISAQAVFPARARPNSLARHFIDYLQERMQKMIRMHEEGLENLSLEEQLKLSASHFPEIRPLIPPLPPEMKS